MEHPIYKTKWYKKCHIAIDSGGLKGDCIWEHIVGNFFAVLWEPLSLLVLAGNLFACTLREQCEWQQTLKRWTSFCACHQVESREKGLQELRVQFHSIGNSYAFLHWGVSFILANVSVNAWLPGRAWNFTSYICHWSWWCCSALLMMLWYRLKVNDCT